MEADQLAQWPSSIPGHLLEALCVKMTFSNQHEACNSASERVSWLITVRVLVGRCLKVVEIHIAWELPIIAEGGLCV